MFMWQSLCYLRCLYQHHMVTCCRYHKICWRHRARITGTTGTLRAISHCRFCLKAKDRSLRHVGTMPHRLLATYSDLVIRLGFQSLWSWCALDCKALEQCTLEWPLVSKSLPTVGGPTAESCTGQYLVPGLPLPSPATKSISKTLPRGPAPLHHQLSWELSEDGHLGLQRTSWTQKGGPACTKQAAPMASAFFGPRPPADPVAGHQAALLSSHSSFLWTEPEFRGVALIWLHRCLTIWHSPLTLSSPAGASS